MGSEEEMYCSVFEWLCKQTAQRFTNGDAVQNGIQSAIELWSESGIRDRDWLMGGRKW